MARPRLCGVRRRRRHRHRQGRCGGHRRLCRQHRAQDRRRHGPADGPISAGCDDPLAQRPHRIFFRAFGVPPSARTHGPAPRQWRGFSRAERHRHQKPWRHRRRRFCRGDRARPWRGARRTARQNHGSARPVAWRAAERAARSRVMTVRRSVVLGCGSYLPSQILTNAELARKVDTSDDWIVQRTGIHERRIAAPGELTSHMATHAARAALAHAKLDAQAIDLIVLATSTPDNTFPASAVAVQADLGITHGAAFDVQAVCSGFVFALATADALLRSGAFSRALVIGSETFSRILDWSDRGTCVLFGDGAGTVVLEALEQPGTRADRGVLTVRLRSDGRYKSKLYVDGGPSSTGTVGHLRMEGREVFRHAVAMITDVVEDAFKITGTTVADI